MEYTLPICTPPGTEVGGVGTFSPINSSSFLHVVPEWVYRKINAVPQRWLFDAPETQRRRGSSNEIRNLPLLRIRLIIFNESPPFLSRQVRTFLPHGITSAAVSIWRMRSLVTLTVLPLSTMRRSPGRSAA